MKKLVQNKIFFRFLLSYVLIILIPLTLLIYAYFQNLAVMEENFKSSGMASLENFKTYLDEKCESIKQYSSVISNNKVVNSYTSKEGPMDDKSSVVSINDVRETLSQSFLSNNFVDSLFLYFPKSGVVITPGNTSFDYQKFYGYYFSYGNYSADEFFAMLDTQPHFNTFWPSTQVKMQPAYSKPEENQKKGFLYMQSFPPNSTPKGQLVMVVFLDEIERRLLTVTEEWGADIYVTNEKGTLFYSTNSENPLPQDIAALSSGDNEEMHRKNSNYVMQVKSNVNKWSYVMKIPESVISDKLMSSKVLLTVYIILAVLVAVGMALVFTIRNTRPIMNALSIVREWNMENGARTADDSNDIEYLSSSLQNLYQNSEEVKANLSRQAPLLRNTFVKSLLDGTMMDSGEIDWYLRQLGFSPLKGTLLVLMIEIGCPGAETDQDIIGKLNMLKVVCEKVFLKLFQTDVYFYDNDFSTRTLIFSVETAKDEADARERIGRTAKNLTDQINMEFGFFPFFAAGSFAAGYEEIALSYGVAEAALSNALRPEGTYILWPENSDNSAASYCSLGRYEGILTGALRAGNYQEFRCILNDVYQNNFVRQQSSLDLAEMLISQVKSLLLKVIDTLPGNTDNLLKSVFEIKDVARIDDAFRKVELLAEQLCKAIEDGKNEKVGKLMSSIRRYVDENYSDSQLNLNNAAYHFNISASYLSQLFKDSIGKNFSKYLEDLRIETACQYLLKDMPVNLVAERVGYNSVYVFRTAFKREMGVLPGSYKELHNHRPK